MKKTAVILMLIAFAAVCASQIEVDLTLRNSNTAIRVAVPEGAFQMIDNQTNLFLLSENSNNSSFSEETTAEDNVRAAWCKLESEKEYEQFRQLWDIDSPALSTEYSAPAQEQTDLTEDLFEKCLVSANYLDIQGKYAKCFFKNMVKYGLFGKHSVDIMSSEILSACNMSYDTFWELLYAFLNQIGFEYRITHPSTGKTMLKIEKAYAQATQIDEKYTGLPQETKMRTVLYSKLGETFQEKEKNEAVLGWLLSNIGGSSVDIQYFTEITSKDLYELTQTIKSLTTEHGRRPCVDVEGLSLVVVYAKNTPSLLPIANLVPHLFRLKVFFNSSITNSKLRSFFPSVIIVCKTLKALYISNKSLPTLFVSSLVKHLPNIVHLTLCCKLLENTVAEEFKNCPFLTSLKIYYEVQTSLFVQKLAANLPSLRELSITCEPLDKAAAESLTTCSQINKLKLEGSLQTNLCVQTLAANLLFLREIDIVCNDLRESAAESFKACRHLEKIKIMADSSFELQGFVLQRILQNVPTLRELEAKCKVLEHAAAEDFKHCPHLKTLTLCGETQTIFCVVSLLKYALHVQSIKIPVSMIDSSLARALCACKELRHVELTGHYVSGFMLTGLKNSLFSALKTLKLFRTNINEELSQDDKEAVKEAQLKGVFIVC
ncbi:hypothetical protein NECID01_2142 [Nematocida sp. AWRm77]|nr:hypothetical protein NECID01_2142 [Nematocida sp. AWRm77]